MSEVKVPSDLVIRYDDRGQGDATVVLLDGFFESASSVCPQNSRLAFRRMCSSKATGSKQH